MSRRPAALAIVLLAAASVSACGSGGSDAKPKPKLRVVATTAQVADFVRAVGGSRVQVDQLIPNTRFPHDYRPDPKRLETLLKDADLVIRSGGDLDPWLPGAAKRAGVQDIDLTDLSKAVVLRERDGRVDFHWWQDPRNVGAAALKIRDELIKRDADGSRPYRGAAARYRTKLERLDAAAGRCMREVLGGVRKLFTAHQAFGYFAARYRLEDAGAAIEGRISPGTDHFTAVDALTRRIRDSGVIAVFPEHGLAGANDALAKAAPKARVRLGDELYGDTLGRADGPDARYVGAFAHDTQAIAHGLGVPPSNCPMPRWP